MNVNSRSMIPFECIEKAVNGDLEVVDCIKEHYRPYYSKLSLRLMKDKYGNTHMVVDEILRSRMENRLLMMILNFEIR